MLKYLKLLSIPLVLLLGNSINLKAQEYIQRKQLFDDNWKFFLGDFQGAEKPSFNDKMWREIDLPHDWSIESLQKSDTAKIAGPFSLKRSQGKRSTGYTVGGTGWYRKSFSLDPKENYSNTVICFDGVYMNCDIWVNGKLVGTHPYGYTPFDFNITAFLNPAGRTNLIAVKVKNEGRNSRWYSGSGIYRHVSMIRYNHVHIVLNSVFITTENISSDKANIKISADIANNDSKSHEIKLLVNIVDPDGKIVQSDETPVKSISLNSEKIIKNITISKPKIWSLETPNLYSAETRIIIDGVLRDMVNTTFGIRTISFNANTGFILNGKKVLLKGGNMHHDNGFLGSAAIDRAEERRVQLMKAYGFNAIRTSHNPPSKHFLDACDRIGILVLDEAFDMWEREKNPQDYHLYFKDWWGKDLESMILRDRNHPSVIFWSIGNEVNERADSTGYLIAKRLAKKIRELDPTRPVTEAISGFWDHPGQDWSTTAPAFAILDVGGYNYQRNQYESDHKQFPERVIMGTESFPNEVFEYWQQVETNPWVIGDFVWTAMDYLGEAGVGSARLVDTARSQVRGPSRSVSWPAWYNAFCGDIDLCGFKKPQLFYKDVVWNNSKLEMAVHSPIPDGKKEVVSQWGWPDELQSWNWKDCEGKMMDVRVFTRYQAIRIELNGKIIAEKELDKKSKMIANFKVHYEPGVLKAVALENGIAITSKELRTTGSPSGIRLTPDRSILKADRNDLSYVKIEITDSQGNVVPNADIPVTLTLSGNGEIAGSGNACPYDMESFNNSVCKMYHGQALAIIRPLKEKKPGLITLRAKANGLTPGEVNVTVQ